MSVETSQYLVEAASVRNVSDLAEFWDAYFNYPRVTKRRIDILVLYEHRAKNPPFLAHLALVTSLAAAAGYPSHSNINYYTMENPTKRHWSDGRLVAFKGTLLARFNLKQYPYKLAVIERLISEGKLTEEAETGVWASCIPSGKLNSWSEERDLLTDPDVLRERLVPVDGVVVPICRPHEPLIKALSVITETDDLGRTIPFSLDRAGRMSAVEFRSRILPQLAAAWSIVAPRLDLEGVFTNP